jgi:dihydroceramidase
LGLRGILASLQHGHDHIFLISFIGYLLIGLGSFWFHATLKCWFSDVELIELKKLTAFADPMQLFDELSMIYTICIMCYATFSFSQHRIFRQILGTGLIGLAVFITV